MTGPAPAGSVELILVSAVTLALSGNVQDTLVRGRYSISYVIHDGDNESQVTPLIKDSLIAEVHCIKQR